MPNLLVRSGVLVGGYCLALFSARAGTEPAGPPTDEEVGAQARALSADSWEARQAAFDRLREWGSRHPGIAELLPRNDPDPNVRDACARLRRHMHFAVLRVRSLGLVPGDAGWETAVETLFADPGEKTVRTFSRVAQGRWSRPGGEVLAMFLDVPDLDLRKGAIWGIVMLNRFEKKDRLMRILDDPEPTLRSASAAALTGLARRARDEAFTASLTERLKRLAEKDPDWNVRQIAANGVGTLARGEGIPLSIRSMHAAPSD